MSKGRRVSKAERRKRQQKRASDNSDVIQDTAAVFTCFHETARDFAYQCESGSDDLEIDLAFNSLAYEIWQDHPRARALAVALADFIAERRRHLEALADLGRRFDALAQQELHEHLDPPEKYRALVRDRLFPDPRSAPST
jgi:hypothetical protein